MQIISLDHFSGSAVPALMITASIAAWTDWTSWRIPNCLTVASMSAALMFAVFAPDGIGLQKCLLGGLTGFTVFLPLYFLKGMAAGDVKLMAAIGMYVGPTLLLDIALFTCLIGGVWALIAIAMRNSVGFLPWVALRCRMILNFLTASSVSRPSTPKKDMLPYGVVIALGTFAALL